MNGCSSLSSPISTCRSTARAVSRDSASSPSSRGLASSIYQSQNSLHAKSYIFCAALPVSYSSRLAVIWRTASLNRLSIHLSGSISLRPSSGIAWPSRFITTKREAFHTLLAKLRHASNFFSLTRMSLPGLTPSASENLSASAP